MSRSLVSACICLVLLAGCAAHELRGDQDRLRATLLDLYTDQVMDNLIRAGHGLPIIQLDYSNVNASVTVEESATVGDSLAATRNTQVTNALAKTLVLTRTMVNTLTGSGNLANTNLVAISANPVLSNDNVYNAYLTYLGMPGSLQCSAEKPPECTTRLCRKCGKRYYWIPLEFQRQFYDLATITMSERDRLLIPPPDFFPVTIVDVSAWEGAPPTPGVHLVKATLGKMIPNDTGTIRLTNGVTLKFDEYQERKQKNPDGSTVPALNFFMTDSLALRLSEPTEAGYQSIGELKAALPLSGEAHLEKYKPPVPTTRELLQRMTFRAPQVDAPDSK